MDMINDLHELCDTLSREVAEANDKIRTAGGKLTSGDLDYVDKLTHALKSIKATIGMVEDEEGYSNYSYPDGMGGSYTVPRGSYAGRGMNARRDSMGRYSRMDGYSRNGGMANELRELMKDAPNDSIKRDIQRIIDKIDM